MLSASYLSFFILGAHLVEPVSQADHECGLSHRGGFLGGQDNDSLPVVV